MIFYIDSSSHIRPGTSIPHIYTKMVKDPRIAIKLCNNVKLNVLALCLSYIAPNYITLVILGGGIRSNFVSYPPPHIHIFSGGQS